MTGKARSPANPTFIPQVVQKNVEDCNTAIACYIPHNTVYLNSKIKASVIRIHRHGIKLQARDMNPPVICEVTALKAATPSAKSHRKLPNDAREGARGTLPAHPRFLLCGIPSLSSLQRALVP